MNSSQRLKAGKRDRGCFRRGHAGHQRSRRPGSCRAAIAAGVPVIPIPGANAALSALIASGLPTARISLSRLSAGESRRPPHAPRRSLSRRAPRDCAQTLIFYEAPHRIADTLADLESVWGPDCALSQPASSPSSTKNFCAAPSPKSARPRRPRPHPRRIRPAHRSPCQESAAPPGRGFSKPGKRSPHRVARLQSEAGIDEKEALKRLARELGQSKSELYRELQRERATAANRHFGAPSPIRHRLRRDPRPAQAVSDSPAFKNPARTAYPETPAARSQYPAVLIRTHGLVCSRSCFQVTISIISSSVP